MIHVLTTLRIRPGSLEAFADIAQPLILDSRREPACRRYDMLASMTDPDEVVFIEIWHDRAALDRHHATPHFTTFQSASTPLVVSARVEVLHPDTPRPPA